MTFRGGYTCEVLTVVPGIEQMFTKHSLSSFVLYQKSFTMLHKFIIRENTLSAVIKTACFHIIWGQIPSTYQSSI